MLILGRRNGEAFLIEDQRAEPALYDENTIKVRVLSIRGNHVSIGIKAANRFHIVREELVGKDL